MTREIDILVVEPGKAPRPARVVDTLDTFAEIVGGPIEAGCYLPSGLCWSATARAKTWA